MQIVISSTGALEFTQFKYMLIFGACYTLTRLYWTGLDGWTRLDWTGLDWTGLDWTGLEWTGVDWTGLDWTGLGWTGVD